MYIKGGIHFFAVIFSTLYIEEHYIIDKKMLKLFSFNHFLNICVMSIIVLGKNDTPIGLISPKYIFMLLIAAKNINFHLFYIQKKNKVFFSQQYTLHKKNLIFFRFYYF